MPDGCIGDCLVCGKCAVGNPAVLDNFTPFRAQSGRDGYGIAIDIGTTTVVLALINLFSGAVLARHSFLNPQRAWGADVITRISAANAGHLKAMQAVLVTSLRDGVQALLSAQDIGEPSEIVIAGNTTMVYVLLGLPCESLGMIPFRPACAVMETYLYSVLFGAADFDCPVRIVPYIGAFVGGDVTAGLVYVLSDTAPCFLLADLGTNGEMALCDGTKLWVTSTAAGPAFEGGSPTTREFPRGASAVLDDLARLVRNGTVDETGRLRDSVKSPFTQRQIRDLQLAKSAVRTGVDILLDEADLTYDALDAVYLAGGIGQAICPDSAEVVGLLPPGVKVCAVGNASLGGAARILTNPNGLADASALVARAKEIHLAAHPRFNELFVEHMGFGEI